LQMYITRVADCNRLAQCSQCPDTLLTCQYGSRLASLRMGRWVWLSTARLRRHVVWPELALPLTTMTTTYARRAIRLSELVASNGLLRCQKSASVAVTCWRSWYSPLVR